MRALVVLTLLAACHREAKSPATPPTSPDGKPAQAAGPSFIVEYADEERGAALVKGDGLIVHSDGLLEILPGDNAPNAGQPQLAQVDEKELEALRRLLADPATKALKSTQYPGEGEYTFIDIYETDWQDIELMRPLP